jgi:hypothetical protein
VAYGFIGFKVPSSRPSVPAAVTQPTVATPTRG